MKLLLTSEGPTNKTILQALKKLIRKPFSKTSLVFIPTASNVEEGDKTWLINDYINLKKQNFKSIDIVDISALPINIWLPRIEKADVILVGGGNTFHLMYWLRKSGLDKKLPELLKTKVYVGISAGSMVTTKNLRLKNSQQIYYEKTYPLASDDGLGFVNFHIRPHLNSIFFPKVRIKYIKEVSKNITEPIYVIDDNTAVVVEDGKVSVASEGKYFILNEHNLL